MSKEITKSGKIKKIQINVNKEPMIIRKIPYYTNLKDNKKISPLKVVRFAFSNKNLKKIKKNSINSVVNKILKAEQKYIRKNHKMRYDVSFQETSGLYSATTKRNQSFTQDSNINFDFNKELFEMITSPEQGESVYLPNKDDVKYLYLHVFFDYIGGDNDKDGYCFWKLINNYPPIKGNNYIGFLNSKSNIYNYDINGTVTENDLENIEKQFKISLFVTGDIYYSTKITNPKGEFKLIFQGNHWEINANDQPKIKCEKIKLDGFEFKEYVYINGEIRKKNKKDEIKKLKIINDKEIIQITKIKSNQILENQEETLTEYINQYEELKEKTTIITKQNKEYSLDLLQYSNVNALIRHKINLKNKHLLVEPVQGYEYKIMESAKWGQYSMPLTTFNANEELINATKEKYEIVNNKTLNNYVSENYYHYDVVSCFPYILSADNLNIPFINSKQLKIPLTAGKFEHKKLEYFEKDLNNKTLKYGYYKCEIIKSTNNPFNKFIRSTNEWYTNIDLYLIKDIMKFGDKDENGQIILKDDENNFMSANQTETINSNNIFGSYINEIIKLKQENPTNIIIKSLLSRLHSAFIQYDKRKEIHKEENIIDGAIIYENLKSTDYITELDQNGSSVIIDTTQPFKSPLARLKCWLYAYQRAFMWNAIKPYLKTNQIVQLLADGFYSDKPIREFDKNSKEIGNIIRK